MTDLAWAGVVALVLTEVIHLPLVLSRQVDPGVRDFSVPLGLFGVLAPAYLVYYQAICIWLTGRTAGKAMFGLRVRRAATRSGLLWALGRQTAGYVVTDVFGAGTVAALWDPRHRCLHDLVFGSEVVLDRSDPAFASGGWSRLLAFEDERKAASEEKLKSFRTLKGFVRFSLELALPLGWLLRLVRGNAETAPAAAPAATASVVAVSAKTTAAIVAATTALSAAVAASPPVRKAFQQDRASSGIVKSTPSPTGSPSSPTSDPTPTPATVATMIAIPTHLIFGAHDVGTASSELGVDATSGGAGQVLFEATEVTGANPDEFSAAHACTGLLLTAERGCRIRVRFSPRVVGGRSGILTIRSKGADPLTVALSGTGRSPAGTTAARVDPPSLDFGERPVDSTSARKTVTVTNAGSRPLDIGLVEPSGGHQGDFLVAVDNCSGVTLAVGQRCSAGVVFAPTATGGRSTALRIHHSASDGPSTVALTGTGLPPPTDPPPTSPPPLPSEEVQCQGKVATIVGTPGPDELFGDEGANVIAGLGGDDQIHGRGGDDTICGNDGDDVIWGEDGVDVIAGDEGGDRIYGGAGNDRVLGLAGEDRLSGGDGTDVVEGGDDKDTVSGNAGSDIVRGGEGPDLIAEGPGHDERGSPDRLEGGGGIDLLDALDGASNDVLDGGPDRDRCRIDPNDATSACETFG